jgi:hypothetical protein
MATVAFRPRAPQRIGARGSRYYAIGAVLTPCLPPTPVVAAPGAELSGMGDPVPPLFWFRDPEGGRLMVVDVP